MTTASHAASPLADSLRQPWRWVAFTTRSGLPSNRVAGIAEMPDGRIWVRTFAGAAWFDGYRWTAVGPDKGLPPTLHDAIVPVGNGQVLVVAGLRLYQGSREGFRDVAAAAAGTPLNWRSAARHPTRQDAALLLDDAGRLFVFDGREVTPPEPEVALLGRRVNNLIEAGPGHLLAAADGGLFEWGTGAWRTRLTAGQLSVRVPANAACAGRETWVHVIMPPSVAGLWRIDAAGRTAREPTPDHRFVEVVTCGRDGDVAVVYDNGDVFLRDAAGWKPLDPLPAQLFNVLSVRLRANGDLWVGSEQGLFLNRRSSSRWQTLDASTDRARNTVNDFVRLGDVSRPRPRSPLGDDSGQGPVLKLRHPGRTVKDFYGDFPEILDAVGRALGGDPGHLVTRVQGRDWEAHYTPLRDAAGHPDGLIGLGIDITERRAAEESLRASEEHFRRAFLASPVATSITAAIEPRVLSLNEVVINFDRMLRRLIGEDIEMVTIAAPGLWPVKADAGQLEQVLVNIVVNARDAMPAGGTITIETANVELDAAAVRDIPDLAPGPHVRLSVSDTGVGMDAATLGHMFEPFFTTKEPGKGTGLGLATCYGIIKQNGGHIAVRSAEGRGTTFDIYHPKSDEPGETDDAADTTARDTAGREAILLVEDEPQVRQLAAGVLRAQGYEVVDAATGSEALEVATRQGAVFDLMVTDLVMPQISGTEVARRLRARHPELRVLFVSGYTDSPAFRQELATERTAFLPKSFEAQVRQRTCALRT